MKKQGDYHQGASEILMAGIPEAIRKLGQSEKSTRKPIDKARRIVMKLFNFFSHGKKDDDNDAYDSNYGNYEYDDDDDEGESLNV